MTQYAGENYLITHTATFDGDALTGPDVEVTIEISKGTGDEAEEILASTPMTWDAVQLRWEYVWDTAGLDPGTYKAKFEVTGIPGLGVAFEFERIRLARPLFT